MTVFSRRSLLGSATVLPAVALVGCGGQTVGQISVTVIADLNLIVDGLDGILPLISGIAGIPADLVAKARAIIGQIQVIAAQVSTSASLILAQTSVKAIESLLNDLVTAVTPFVAAVPIVGQAFMAASILLPIIEELLGLIPGFTIARRASPEMSPMRARAVLLSVIR